MFEIAYLLNIYDDRTSKTEQKNCCTKENIRYLQNSTPKDAVNLDAVVSLAILQAQ